MSIGAGLPNGYACATLHLNLLNARLKSFIWIQHMIATVSFVEKLLSERRSYKLHEYYYSV